MYPYKVMIQTPQGNPIVAGSNLTKTRAIKLARYLRHSRPDLANREIWVEDKKGKNLDFNKGA